MSASLVRVAHLARSICSTCRTSCCLRLYSSQALLVNPVTIAEVFAHTSPSTSSRPQLVAPASDDCNSTESKPAEVSREKRGRKKKVIIQDEDPSRNPLEDNGIEAYLNILKTTGVEPTIEDLERCRPLRRYRGLTPQYEEQFEAFVDRLCRSFSRSQLRTFCAQYKLKARSDTPKKKLALLIIEKRWKWPSMDDLKRKKIEETKIEQLVYPVVPSQLFLILGKDGIELLRMSQKYNVHISLKADPLQLQIEGVKQSVEKLQQHLTRRTELIVEKIFELPTKAPIRPDLIQRLSRLADAFIQNVGEDGQVRICALNHNHLLAAQRLATRAACEMTEYSQEQYLVYIPPGSPSSTPLPISLFPNSYSLYPFLSPRSLPWTMNTSGAFRIRRVGEWLASNVIEDVQKTGGLAEGRGRLLATDETASNLERALFSPLNETDAPSVGRSRSVTASLGHMLLTSTSTEQRATIAPPLAGTWVISKILRWFQTADIRTAFVPSLPAPMSNASPACQKMLLRLIYHSISALPTTSATSIIKLEVVLPKPGGYPSNQAEETSELPLEDGPVDEETPKSPPSMPESASENLEFSCWKGQQTSVHIFMPDRPMDIRFSAFDSCEVLHAQLPPELRRYLTALSAFMSSQDLTAPQPKAPLTLQVDGQAYILNSYSSVRQNIEPLQDLAEAKSIGSEFSGVGVLSESITDLENRHKIMHCQVECRGHQSPLNWKEFLHKCDHLSSMSYRPIVGFSRMGAQDLISATEAENSDGSSENT